MLNMITLGRYEKIFVLLFFIVFAYFTLGANIFDNQIVAPMDLLLQYPGFYESGIHMPPVNPERSDIVAGQIPMETFVREQLLKGNLPFWDPLRNGGVPTNLPDAPVIPMLFRPDFLCFLIWGNGFGYTIGIIVKLVIMGFGAYLLCRKWLGPLPSIFAGVTIVLAGTNVVWLFTDIPLNLGWAPWILWSIKRILDKPSAGNLAVFSSTITMEIISAFQYFIAISIYLAIVFGVAILFSKYKRKDKILRKSFLYCAIGLFLSVLISSIFYFPAFEWLNQADIGSRSNFTPFHNDFEILWNPLKYNMSIGDHTVPRSELTGYVGTITLLLLPFSLIGLFTNKLRRLPTLFWIITSVVTSIIVFGISPLSDLIYKIYPFNTSLNSRAIGFLSLELSILSAFGLQQVVIGLQHVCTKLKISKGRVIALSLISLILIVQIISLVPLVRITDAVVPADSWYPLTPTLEYVKHNLLPGQSVIATSAYMESGTVTAYGIPEWFALGSYFHPQQKEVLDNVVHDAFRDPAAAAFTGGNLRVSSDYNEALFVKYILVLKSEVNLSSLPDKWNVIEKGSDVVILENKKVTTGAYLIPTNSSFENFDENSIIVNNIKNSMYSTDHMKYIYDGNQKGYLVVPIRPWTGWTAYVNGHPSDITPYLKILSAVKVDELPAVIEFRYEPIGIKIGSIFSTIGIVSIIIIYLYERKHTRLSNDI